MKEVSIFKEFKIIVDNQSIPSILEEIRTGKYKAEIIYLRNCLTENNIEAYDKKKMSLLAFTPSGKFDGGRGKDFVTEYSSVIILDIDKLDSEILSIVLNTANQSEFTYASFISPSGRGVKILVKVNSQMDRHKQAYLFVQTFYEKLLNVTIDKSGKDVSRLCFYSYDENLYFNENASVFIIPAAEDNLLISNRLPVSNDLCLNNSDMKKINEDEYYSVYLDCVKYTKKSVEFINGSRNNFVHQLACNLNREGLPLKNALSLILTEYNYDETEVTNSVISAFNNVHEYSIKVNKKQTEIEKLENYLLSKYNFRHNEVSGKLEFQYVNTNKWKLSSEFFEN